MIRALLPIYSAFLSLLAPLNALHAQSHYTTPYVFSTFAGSPAGGAVDGTGSAARFYNPRAVAVDASGNCYVADTYNYTIRKITSAGVVTTLAGLAGYAGSVDGTGSAARFSYPAGIAVDASGNVFVGDTSNNVIRKVTPAGVVTTFAGLMGATGSANGTGTAARFYSPSGVAIDGAGNLYVADATNCTIRKITSTGTVSTLAGTAGSRGANDGQGGAASFNGPEAVTVDASGNVYVADVGNHSIRKITSAGLVSTLAGSGSFEYMGSTDGTGSAARFYNPYGVAVDTAGNVYVGDYRNHTIRKITPAGEVTTLAGLASTIGSADGTGPVARFNYPAGLSVDGSGNVYVADLNNNVIRKITAGGEVTTFAGTSLSSGSVDGTGANAKFAYLQDVAVDGSGNLYVADTLNSTIRKITPAGVVTTLAGSAMNMGATDGTGSDASFTMPRGVAVDGAGNVYVADTFNCTIRKITPGGEVTTLAGFVGQFGSTNGIGPNARFGYVDDVAADSAGNVYVADAFNSRIRKITSAGVVTTFAGGSGGSGSTDGPAMVAQFSLPAGVAVDAADNVFVADTANHTIRKITPAGVVTTFAGSAGLIGSTDGTGSAARFRYPRGIVVDSSGMVYVSDDNNTIRRITPDGVVSTIAGTTDLVGSSNGTGAAALFYRPRGLAVDGSGNLYVADYYNHSIRKGSAPPAAPSITTQPASQAVSAGSSATLSVAVTGNPPPTYQWRKNGVAIAGATTYSLMLTNLLPGDAGNYDVVVTNSQGSVTSSAATLTVDGLPVITALSSSRQLLAPGQTLNLSVTATGTGGTRTYQWLHNNAVIPGATNTTYSLSNITMTGGGWYQVLVTDSAGTTRSTLMFVTVAPAATQIVGWGYNGYHQIDVPVGLYDATAVSVGYNYSLALKANGSVAAWGDGSNGEPNVPAGLNDVVAIQGNGGSHVLALKSDGTVVAWGNNYNGECNIPAGLKYVAMVATGSAYSVALRADGTLAVWGTAPNSLAAAAAALSGVVSISAKAGHLLVLKSDGTVVGLGDNSYGESTVPPGLTNVIAVAAGRNHSLALKNDGTVVAWGWNYGPYGQTNIPVGLAGVTAIAAGADFSLAIKNDRTLVAWGDNGYSQCEIPSSASDVLAVSGSDQFAVALRDSSADVAPSISSQPAAQTVLETSTATFSVTATGRGPFYYQWRKGGVSIAGATASSYTIANVLPSHAGNYDVVVSNHVGGTASTVAILAVNPLPVVTSLSPTRHVLTAGQNLSLSVTATGSGALSYQWVHNGVPINGATGNGYSLSNVTRQSSGWYVALITDSIGTRRSAPIFVTVAPAQTQLRYWGSNGASLPGDLPTNLTDLIAIDTAGNRVLGLKRDGGVISWQYEYPAYVTTTTGLSNVVAISDGNVHSLALLSDGTVSAWGSNDHGELNVPPGLTGVVAISAGFHYSLALKSDGTVVGWGDNSDHDIDIPGTLTGVVAIEAGHLLPLALKNNGTVISWGQYGNRVPGSVTGVAAISTFPVGSSLVALENDGTVVTALGPPDTPTGLTGVIGISAGNTYALALKSDGSVYGWGYNTYGEATPPSNLTNVYAVSAGQYISWALRDPTSDPVINTQPASQTVLFGTAVTFTVGASGGQPITYQWRKDGANIPGATGSSYTISNCSAGDSGSYTVVVTNAFASVTSNVATLTATTTIPPSAAIISITVE